MALLLLFVIRFDFLLLGQNYHCNIYLIWLDGIKLN